MSCPGSGQRFPLGARRGPGASRAVPKPLAARQGAGGIPTSGTAWDRDRSGRSFAPTGVTGCPEGSAEGEVGSVGTRGGLKWWRPPCQDPGEPSTALWLSRIFPARTGRRGGLGGPSGQGRTGGDFPRCQRGGGSCFQVPKGGCGAQGEFSWCFASFFFFFFCLIRRIHSRVPLPGAVSGVWNKR